MASRSQLIQVVPEDVAAAGEIFANLFVALQEYFILRCRCSELVKLFGFCCRRTSCEVSKCTNYFRGSLYHNDFHVCSWYLRDKLHGTGRAFVVTGHPTEASQYMRRMECCQPLSTHFIPTRASQRDVPWVSRWLSARMLTIRSKVCRSFPLPHQTRPLRY